MTPEQYERAKGEDDLTKAIIWCRLGRGLTICMVAGILRDCQRCERYEDLLR